MKVLNPGTLVMVPLLVTVPPDWLIKVPLHATPEGGGPAKAPMVMIPPFWLVMVPPFWLIRVPAFAASLLPLYATVPMIMLPSLLMVPKGPIFENKPEKLNEPLLMLMIPLLLIKLPIVLQM